MQAMWSRFSLRRVFKDMTSIISLSLTLLQAATVASSLHVYITYHSFTRFYSDPKIKVALHCFLLDRKND
jgi:hypothetical protein